MPLLCLLLAWLLGALPIGARLARARGADPAGAGSGSTGATNVGRLLGWRWGLLTGLLDAAKGALAVTLGGLAEPEAPWLPPLLGLLAVTGHCWSPFARWRGGKGAATGAGAALLLAPQAALLSLGGAAAILLLGRRMSLASLGGVALFPAVLYLTNDVYPASQAFGLGLLILVWLAHRGNLARLAGGREEALWHWPGK